MSSIGSDTPIPALSMLQQALDQTEQNVLPPYSVKTCQPFQFEGKKRRRYHDATILYAYS